MCEARVDNIDLEMLLLMKKAGCVRIAYGIESGVQKLLDNIRKGFTLGQTRRAVELTKRTGIEIIAYFMIGLPGETVELSRQTVNFAMEIDADFVKFNLTVPYPGTDLYDEAVHNGQMRSIDWEQFTSLNAFQTHQPVYVPEGMRKEELVDITKKAIRRYYFRPSMIFKHLRKIKSLSDIRRYYHTGLALFKISS